MKPGLCFLKPYTSIIQDVFRIVSFPTCAEMPQKLEWWLHSLAAKLKTADRKLTTRRELPEKTEQNFQLPKSAMEPRINREHDHTVTQNLRNYIQSARCALCVIAQTETLARLCCFDIAAGNIINGRELADSSSMVTLGFFFVARIARGT